jgi:hypothetical protein
VKFKLEIPKIELYLCNQDFKNSTFENMNRYLILLIIVYINSTNI